MTSLDKTERVSGQPLRERVLRTVLSWFAVGSLVQGPMLVLHAYLHGSVRLDVWMGALGLLLVPVLWWLEPRLGYRRASFVLLAHLLCVCTYFQLFRGLTPGSVLGSLTFLMLAGLFFGARGVIWAFAASIVALLIASGFVLGSVVQPWEPWYWDPEDPLVWVRYANVLCAYGGGVCAALLITVQGLERMISELEDTLLRERAERERREALQHDLEKARRLETLGRYAAGIAHDFNNNLAVIGSSAELLRMDMELPEEARALVDEISNSTQSGASTVRQLLSLGRNEAGQPEPVQLHELLRRSLSTLRATLGESVKLTLEVEARAQAFVDVGRMRQTLLNLVLNARDALPRGGHVGFRLYERELSVFPGGFRARPGKYLTLECRDDGVGIAPELLGQIFEPFFTTKSAREGSGLGLSLVRKTVYDADGFIEVSSQLGAGTTISLSLPVYAPDALQPSAASQGVSPKR